MEERFRSHYESLSRAIALAAAADYKAAPILAVQVALAGTLAARSDKLTSILTSQPLDAEGTAFMILIVAYALFLIVDIMATGWVYVPRTPRTGKSLIYFEDIGPMSIEDFSEQAGRMEPNLIETQLLEQIHSVSKIASQKMRRVWCAYVLSAPTIILWVVLVAWGSVSPTGSETLRGETISLLFPVA